VKDAPLDQAHQRGKGFELGQVTGRAEDGERVYSVSCHRSFLPVAVSPDPTMAGTRSRHPSRVIRRKSPGLDDDHPGSACDAVGMSDFALSEAESRALYERLRRTSVWGPDDRLGTLNNISTAEVVAAASDVRGGRTVSLAAPIESRVAADNPDPAVHQMT